MSRILSATIKVYSYAEIKHERLFDHEDDYVTESVEKKTDHTEICIWTKGDLNYDDIISSWRNAAGLSSVVTITYFTEGAGQQGFICGHQGQKVEKHFTIDDNNQLWDEEDKRLRLIPEFNKLDEENQQDIISDFVTYRAMWELAGFEKIVMAGHGVYLDNL